MQFFLEIDLRKNSKNSNYNQIYYENTWRIPKFREFLDISDEKKIFKK